MSPEEPVVAAPVEVTEPAGSIPEPAPAPDSTPPSPEPAPEVQDERSKPTESLWKAIFDRAGDATPQSVPEQLAGAEPRPARPPRPVAPAPTPVPPTSPRTWAGKYETPEALEKAYSEAQTALERAEQERQASRTQAERMERLLYATMATQGAQMGRSEAPGQPPPQAPPTPQQLQQALDLVKQEHERLAMADPEASPLALVRAIAMASQLDEQARTFYAQTALREVWARAEQQQQIQSVQDNFFEHYPDLRQAHPNLLRQLAIETESRLRRARNDYGSPAYMQQWFDDTAKLARAHIRLGDSQGATPPGPVPAPATPSRSLPRSVATPRVAKGAPFSETPTPRANEPQLTGQDVHLARVFGRQP